jgi:hypothetical protein
MLVAALLASSGFFLAANADAGTGKAAQCLARHSSDDFTGETAADITCYCFHAGLLPTGVATTFW